MNKYTFLRNLEHDKNDYNHVEDLTLKKKTRGPHNIYKIHELLFSLPISLWY